eukprot:1882706-Amphidinium_carterae.4
MSLLSAQARETCMQHGRLRSSESSPLDSGTRVTRQAAQLHVVVMPRPPKPFKSRLRSRRKQRLCRNIDNRLHSTSPSFTNEVETLGASQHIS